MVSLYEVFSDLAKAMEDENSNLEADDLPRLRHTEIRVMDQMSLLSNPQIRAQIRLFGTRDVDATVKGEYWVEKKLKELLLAHDLELDPSANEIWLPEGATFSTMYTSKNLLCLQLDPLYALVLKAVKAKEKNRILIRQALPLFGDELRNMIVLYGGDLRYFEEQP